MTLEKYKGNLSKFYISNETLKFKGHNLFGGFLVLKDSLNNSYKLIFNELEETLSFNESFCFAFFGKPFEDTSTNSGLFTILRFIQ